MTYYFFDTSVLIKRYVAEEGTLWVRTVISNGANIISIAQITPVEIVSGAARRKRSGEITVLNARNVRLLVDHHTRHVYEVIGLSSSVIARAEDLLDIHPLRAADAIQLASALEANLRLVANGLPALIFVSADARLLAAATAEGLPTYQPT